MSTEKRRYAVTGGGGFVGKALCQELRGAGHEVISLSRGRYAEVEALGVQTIQVDLGSPRVELSSVLRGCDALFHTAAKVDMWGDYNDFYRSNVTATRNLLEACKRAGVQKFIYTSSPSVVAGQGDLRGVDERQPYPAAHDAYYPATKAVAEREVLAANKGNLWTISLRPHLIFGPGDRNFIPTILRRAGQGRLTRVGNGKNKTDVCFIDDCVQAHVLAERALSENPACRGKAYFITQGEPVVMWDWINEVLRRNNLPPVKRSISPWLAMTIAKFCELGAKLGGSKEVPLLTKFLVHEMYTDHYFNIDAAKRDLGFQPRYSVKEALDLTFSAPAPSPAARAAQG